MTIYVVFEGEFSDRESAMVTADPDKAFACFWDIRNWAADIEIWKDEQEIRGVSRDGEDLLWHDLTRTHGSGRLKGGFKR